MGETKVPPQLNVSVRSDKKTMDGYRPIGALFPPIIRGCKADRSLLLFSLRSLVVTVAAAAGGGGGDNFLCFCIVVVSS